jgi:hypothetical protein
MCSHERCITKSFYDIDGTHYCKFHSPNELGVCGVIQKNGTTCQCPARRSRKGVGTCLVHVPKSSEVVSCSICLDDCPVGTKSTKCGHFFHSACMKEWKKQSNGNTCPMCRVVLTTPVKKVLNGDLMLRASIIAQSSVNQDEFMANLMDVMTAPEIELILNMIRHIS